VKHNFVDYTDLELLREINFPIILHHLPDPLFLIGINPRKIQVWDFTASNLAIEGGYICIVEGELDPQDNCTLGDPSSLLIFINVIVRSSSLVNIVNVIAKPDGKSDALRWREVVLIDLILVVLMVIIIIVKVPSTKDPPGTRCTRRVSNVPHVGNSGGGQRGSGGSLQAFGGIVVVSIVAGIKGKPWFDVVVLSVGLVVIVLVVAIILGFIVVVLVLLNDAWLYSGRRRNRRGGVDGITENRQIETRNRFLWWFPTREKWLAFFGAVQGKRS
jgi:hypothetical protein